MKCFAVYALLIRAITLLCAKEGSHFAVESAYSSRKSGGGNSDECEKRGHISFSPAQRALLCEGQTSNSIGPSLCSNVAKDSLRLKYEDILLLCKGAVSVMPAQCMQVLQKVSNKYNMRGVDSIALCARANSTLPARCITSLLAYTGSDKVKPDSATSIYCSEMEDLSVLGCISAARSVLRIPPTQAMEPCRHAVSSSESEEGLEGGAKGSAIYTCMFDMKWAASLPKGPSKAEVIEFCSGAITTVRTDTTEQSPLAACYAASEKIAPLTALLSPQQRLTLCAQSDSRDYTAPPASSPAPPGREIAPSPPSHASLECAKLVAASTDAKLTGDEVVTLCGGPSGHPGSAQCFLEIKRLSGLSTNGARIRLCAGAPSAGPAYCFRRAQGVFRRNSQGDAADGAVISEDDLRSSLCVGADSEDPAMCAASAPHYLTSLEKVSLCSSVPPSRSSEPTQCLRVVEAASRVFSQAPKRALGLFVGNLLLPAERASRELLISLCSFGASQSPLASAECMKSAPPSSVHDDVVRMCFNASSADIVTQLTLCYKILPRQWTKEDATALCEGGGSGVERTRRQVEASAHCAVEVSSNKLQGGRMKLKHSEAAALCSGESERGAVLACFKAAAATAVSSRSDIQITPAVISQTCIGATSAEPGQCLNKLASHPYSQQLSLDAAVAIHLCRKPNSIAKFDCLKGLRSRGLSTEDVDKCANTVRTPSALKLLRFQSDAGGDGKRADVTAGNNFQIWLQVLDQWGVPFTANGVHSTGDDEESSDYRLNAIRKRERENVYVGVSLNNNNPQGAVLWGLKTNITSNGVLHYSSLAVSQPGKIDLRFSYRPEKQHQHFPGDISSEGASRTLALYALTVLEDPEVEHAAPCVFIFKTAVCPADSVETDWLSEYPWVRGYLPPAYMMQTLLCERALAGWQVEISVLPGGGSWVGYRRGVDAIWTGVGLPSEEMSYEERLGIPPMAPSDSQTEGGKKGKKSKASNTRTAKELRRAYYRMSLLWHPDRWASMPALYAPAVQGAFELISAAYNALSGSSASGNDSSQGDSGSSSGGDKYA